jgi:multicomponent Na+:H+ antiporter subunit B
MIDKYDDLIVETISRLLVPFIQIFGMYVLFLGHYSPGGGFQGGLLIAASLMLLVIAFDIKEAKRRFNETWMIICVGLGAGIFAGIGTLCVAFGANFLDYSAFAPLLQLPPEKARAYAILGIEIGVQVSVAACLFSIFLDLLSRGEHEEALL